MKYITAEGPSSELNYFKIERPAGYTYPAAHEPVRFVPQETPTKAQIKLLCDIRALPFEPIENGRQLLKLIMDYDTVRTEQLETARKALGESEASKAILSRWIIELKAQIGAGQKGGLTTCKRCGRGFAPGTGHSC